MTDQSEPALDPFPFDHRTAARDSVLGLAVGDAFGAQHFVPENLPALAKRQLPPAPWPWTDDTEMACSIFAVLRSRGTVDQWELAHSFAHRHDFDRGYGAAMNRLLRLVREGGSWGKLAAGLFDGQGSWGNGAAMRVAPLGAWFAVDPREAAWQAARSAEVTHAHPEAVAGAVAVAVAAAHAARSRGQHLTPQDLLSSVLELTPASTVREGVAEAQALLDHPHVQLAAHRLGNGRQVSAMDTVPFTLWCAARHLDDFEAALWATASAGGDVDTTCAIVGGILAARLGRHGIPHRWLEATESLPKWLEADRPGNDLNRHNIGKTQPIKHPKAIPVPQLTWTPGQWQRIRLGIASQAMEEKWNVYLDGDRMFWHRSWTGHCIFEVAVEQTAHGWRPTGAWVESDRGTYQRGTNEAESLFLHILLDQYFAKGERTDLRERHQRLSFEA
ncbi:ADP-ribosylglycohydrolase family protein [Streptomyces humicola]|uniref:ADP-ribosylglycohydrolase family protein n=1 Tax=Streptomyces humicola TaxID=2953240 RepID=UPI0027E36F7B|nr:ADP-ribosylglycohydrolase family protein [Streptomyces humicola]